MIPRESVNKENQAKTNPLRIIHVVPAISEEASGPSYLVPRSCEELIRMGHQVTLAALDWAPMKDPPPFLKTFPLGLGPRRLGRSPAMAKWLNEEVKSGEIDILHSHSLWMMPNVYSGWARKYGNCKLIISPHGALTEWALNHHRIRKRLFWVFLQGQTLRRADAFHATAESEYEDLRRLGFRQPVAIVPIGIDMPEYEKSIQTKRRRLLFLSRIHKKKGLDILLPAWKAIQDNFPEWDLIIAGPDDRGYLAKMQKLAVELGVERVSFIGPVYGESKQKIYQSASLYILPTYSENFGITVAEALASGTPAIVTKGAPWSGLIREGAGWWIDIGIEPLIACLKETLALPEDRLLEMGRKGREWMIREFSWKEVAQKMNEFYKWLCGIAPKPACVTEFETKNI